MPYRFFFFLFFLTTPIFFSTAQNLEIKINTPATTSEKPVRVKNQFIVQLEKNIAEENISGKKIENIFEKNNSEKNFYKKILEKNFENIFQEKKINFQLEKILSPDENIFLISTLDSISEKNLSDEITARCQLSIVNCQLSTQYNYISRLRETIPNDRLFSSQWYLQNTGQTSGTIGADIKITKAWDITTGGKTAQNDEIVIALIDDGISIAHPDLKPNLWLNKNEIPNNGIDDDGNGYVDDYQGWNTINNTDSIDVGYHGTEIAGVMGAAGNNNAGIAGINWRVKIMTVVTDGTDASIIAAYAYVLKQRQLYNDTHGARGAFVVATNSSFGRYGFYNSAQMWCDFYDKLGAAGILSVGATDNANRNVDTDKDGDIPSLCPSDYLIMVTSTDDNDLKVGTAAYGVKNIDVGAPGYSILTTAINSSYSNPIGTSVACPMVTGLLGLAYSVPNSAFIERAKNNPAQAALYLKNVLLRNVDTLANLKCKVLTGGRINAFKTINCINNNCNDTFIKTNCITDAVTDISSGDLEIKIYPNPTTDFFTLEFADNLVAPAMDIFDVTGKKIITNSRVQNFEPIYFPTNTPTGIYFIKLTTSEKILIRKIFKE